MGTICYPYTVVSPHLVTVPVGNYDDDKKVTLQPNLTFATFPGKKS